MINHQLLLSPATGISHLSPAINHCCDAYLSVHLSIFLSAEALVLEKELKIREGMRIMAMRDSSSHLAWFTAAAVQMVVTSALLVLVAGSSVFEYSNKARIGSWDRVIVPRDSAHGCAVS